MRRSISWVVYARDISCEDPTGRGCQDGVDSLECGIGGGVAALALFPAVDNSLVVTINCE